MLTNASCHAADTSAPKSEYTPPKKWKSLFNTDVSAPDKKQWWALVKGSVHKPIPFDSLYSLLSSLMMWYYNTLIHLKVKGLMNLMAMVWIFKIGAWTNIFIDEETPYDPPLLSAFEFVPLLHCTSDHFTQTDHISIMDLLSLSPYHLIFPTFFFNHSVTIDINLNLSSYIKIKINLEHFANSRWCKVRWVA